MAFAEPEFRASAPDSAIPWSVDSVVFSDIPAACEGLTYQVAAKTTQDWIDLTDGTTSRVPSGGDLSVGVDDLDPQQISRIALTIHGETSN